MNPKIEKLQTLVITQSPEKADAIIWLQGNMYDRGSKVLALYRGGLAPIILVTGNNVRVVEDDRVKVSDIMRWLEAHDIDRSAILADDQSMNTLQQALHTVGMAKEKSWRTVLLVGSIHHQLRAFLTFLHQARVQKWDGCIINQPAHIDWDKKPSGRRKTTREAFQDELEKVEMYKDNMETVEEGLRYLRRKI